MPPGGTVWKNVYIRVPGANPPWESAAFDQWTLDGVPVGPAFAVGFCISSPVRIGNPSVTPDGTANTADMVVRNLQFAQSPQRIPNEQLTLEDPTAIALFAASPDPVRPGPFTVPPGNCQDVSPDIDPSITAPQPQPNGQTVLVKGIVEDSQGNQYDFVAQFMPEPTVEMALIALTPVVLWLSARRSRNS